MKTFLQESLQKVAANTKEFTAAYFDDQPKIVAEEREQKRLTVRTVLCVTALSLLTAIVVVDYAVFQPGLRASTYSVRRYDVYDIKAGEITDKNMTCPCGKPIQWYGRNNQIFVSYNVSKGQEALYAWLRGGFAQHIRGNLSEDFSEIQSCRSTECNATNLYLRLFKSIHESFPIKESGMVTPVLLTPVPLQTYIMKTIGDTFNALYTSEVAKAALSEEALSVYGQALQDLTTVMLNLTEPGTMRKHNAFKALVLQNSSAQSPLPAYMDLYYDALATDWNVYRLTCVPLYCDEVKHKNGFTYITNLFALLGGLHSPIQTAFTLVIWPVACYLGNWSPYQYSMSHVHPVYAKPV